MLLGIEVEAIVSWCMPDMLSNKHVPRDWQPVMPFMIKLAGNMTEADVADELDACSQDPTCLHAV